MNDLSPTSAVERDNRTSRGLAVFDMDGTLLPGTTACQQIALVANAKDEIDALEANYRLGLIDSKYFAEQALASWALGPSDLYRKAFDACPKIGGIDLALAWCRDRSVSTLLLSMAPKEFAECFEGFDYVVASAYPTDILDPEDKPGVVGTLQATLGLSNAQTIAFGDSDSDVPLFNSLSHTVAVNATPNLIAIAMHSYVGNNLFDALVAAAAHNHDL